MKNHFLNNGRPVLTLTTEHSVASVTLDNLITSEKAIKPVVTDWTERDGIYYTLGRMIVAYLEGKEA